MYRKRMSMAAVVVAAALSLTACGGSGTGDDKAADGASSGSSATASSSSSSSSPSSSSSSSSSSGGTATGAYTPLTKDNFASTIADGYKTKRSAHIEMTMGETVDASGDVNYSGAKPSMKLAMKVTQGGKKIQMEEVLADGTLYMSVPGLTPNGKYVKLDANTPGMAGLGDLLKNVDPAQMIVQMSKSIKKLDYVGTTEIDGDTTHHYKLTVDAKKAVSTMGLNNLPSRAASKVPSTLPYDAYFNDDNTLRRIKMDVMGQSMEMNMTNWGAPVTVTAPKKSDVVDLSKMMPSMPAKP